ncbi:hypothetical protein J3458_002943 [Metarhizium acridum]|uniref:uncharacterized protein n=1 Tax=Metarhizium acridum TaxID=92637 RepID=UPI001C6C3323|nr:hypothetical protein J3458_002943 [Metarhizium acridum]
MRERQLEPPCLVIYGGRMASRYCPGVSTMFVFTSRLRSASDTDRSILQSRAASSPSLSTAATREASFAGPMQQSTISQNRLVNYACCKCRSSLARPTVMHEAQAWLGPDMAGLLSWQSVSSWSRTLGSDCTSHLAVVVAVWLWVPLPLLALSV